MKWQTLKIFIALILTLTESIPVTDLDIACMVCKAPSWMPCKLESKALDCSLFIFVVNFRNYLKRRNQITYCISELYMPKKKKTL